MIGHDPERTYRAVVIGAGSGGLTAAIGLTALGHDVVLVEGDRVGGDCTNVGCIPSKALLHAVRTGITDPLGHTRARRDELARREDDEMEHDEHIHLVRGWASLTGRRDPHVVHVRRPDGTDTEVRADHVVVSGGSRPVTVDVAGLEPETILTNDTLFELREPPTSLLVVGGGAIAIEMATAFNRMGTTVDVVELRSRLLATEDPLITDVVEQALRAQGVRLHLGTTIERLDGSTVHLADGREIPGVDRVLMALGRRPRTDGLGLDRAGIATDGDAVLADDWGRTSVDGIWAIGDITGRTLTTHGANAVGRRVVRAIALPRLPLLGRPRAIPAAVYSDPEIASVGAPLDELAAMPASARRRIVVDYADVDRGYTDEIADGRLVVDVERFTGRVLRAAIVGPGASDLIGIFTLSIDRSIGLRKLFGMVHPYPAHAEVVREAADRFARATYPALPREWAAMAAGRLRRASRRTLRAGGGSGTRTPRR